MVRESESNLVKKVTHATGAAVIGLSTTLTGLAFPVAAIFISRNSEYTEKMIFIASTALISAFVGGAGIPYVEKSIQYGVEILKGNYKIEDPFFIDIDI